MRDLHLCPRERAVARCLLHGWDDALIAKQLGITCGTVKNQYMKSLLNKTGMGTRLELAVFLLRAPWALAQVMEVWL